MMLGKLTIYNISVLNYFWLCKKVRQQQHLLEWKSRDSVSTFDHFRGSQKYIQSDCFDRANNHVVEGIQTSY